MSVRIDVKPDPTEAASRSDTVLNKLKTSTPQEISDWIDLNVNSVDDVKGMLKRMMQLLAVVARRQD